MKSLLKTLHISAKFLLVIIFFLHFSLITAQTNEIYHSIPYSTEKFEYSTAKWQCEKESDNPYNKIGYFFGASSLSFVIDEIMRNNLKFTSNKNNTPLMKIGHSYGDFYYNLYLSSSLLLAGFVTNDKVFSNTGKTLLESLLFGTLASITIKYIFGRSRPYKEEGNLKFNWFETENINNSLPSGHVITAFSTSTVLSKVIDNPYVSIFLYALAGLTAYQRIGSDNHWFSDLFLGASIGYLSAEFFHNQNQRSSNKEDSHSLIPFLFEDNCGIILSFNL